MQGGKIGFTDSFTTSFTTKEHNCMVVRAFSAKGLASVALLLLALLLLLLQQY